MRSNRIEMIIMLNSDMPNNIAWEAAPRPVDGQLGFACDSRQIIKPLCALVSSYQNRDTNNSDFLELL